MNLVTLVIPCYNELESLPILIDKIKSSKKNINFLIVDNGSTDGSKKYLIDIESKLNKNIQIHFININEGYGHGIFTGLKNCETQFVGWFHGDLQFDFDNLEKAYNYLLQNKNSKNIFYKGIRVGRSYIDRFFSVFMGIIATILLRYKFYEINAQPTIFNRELLDKINDPPKDFSFDTYVYWLAKKNKYKFKRDNYKFPAREYGSSKWDIGLKSKLSFSIQLIKYFYKLNKNQAL